MLSSEQLCMQQAVDTKVAQGHAADASYVTAKPVWAQMLASGGPEVEKLREVLNSGGDPSKLAEAAPALQALLQALHG